jgi:hypothetical protein
MHIDFTLPFFNIGSLADDDDLINVLHVTMATAEDVAQKWTILYKTTKKIHPAHEEYRPVMTRGAMHHGDEPRELTV